MSEEHASTASEDGEDQMHRAYALLLGLLMGGVGYWLWANGGGSCVALRFSDSCLMGGTTLGAVLALFGLLILWGGLDAYKQGERYV